MNEIDRLITAIEQLPDAAAREAARAIVREVLELHAGALRQIVAAAPDAVGRCAADPVVNAVLLLHGLHPVGLETRVRRALQPGEELLSIDGGVVRVRARGHGVRERLLEAAPDAEEIVVEDLVPVARLVGGMR
jgi:hypothetical protein